MKKLLKYDPFLNEVLKNISLIAKKHKLLNKIRNPYEPIYYENDFWGDPTGFLGVCASTDIRGNIGIHPKLLEWKDMEFTINIIAHELTHSKQYSGNILKIIFYRTIGRTIAEKEACIIGNLIEKKYINYLKNNK